ncbi:hypothetical protein GRI38_12820 [Altererythrobacter aurantiacus]|uniref:Uncharacterized protein n=1 Tax=Parapontixanthobacter aurantiacus TaxID=1463599 RepID=A0A844ZEG2_9SPHN|nr:hypothetical protein [Parapontixanthobacter aurantiacus]MXO86911.1 hypothetical protein [Parapontixanthobacter aurantiacus]
MTRPDSIRMFEKLFLASIALGIVNMIISFGDTQATLADDPATAQLGSGFAIFIGLFVLGVNLLFWFFIARKASNIAKWILVVFTVLGLVMLPGTLATLSGFALILSLLVTALQLAAIVFLFKQDAKEWFAGKRRPKREHDTDVRMR